MHYLIRPEVIGAALFAVVGSGPGQAQEDSVEPHTPSYRVQETLVSHLEKGKQNYLAFPAVAVGEGENYWISYKRGYAHGRDDEASLEVVEWSPEKEALTGRGARLAETDIVYQMGEWIRFPDGKLMTFIDAQNTDESGRNYRVGLRMAELDEAESTFGEIQRLGEVEGVEYGYLFDSATVDGTVYVLVMTFEDLAGERRTVDVLKTADSGESWEFVRNLSQEFGDIRINESSLIAHGDGFLVATRGYDARQRLHVVDREFRVLRQVDLTDTHDFIEKQIGRPRLFEKDGRYYLIGRNYLPPDSPAKMEMALFELDPESLLVKRYWILDNRERGRVRDGYYPSPFFTKDNGRELLNVIDYKAIFDEAPDIVRFQFRWNEMVPED
ncbi:MAG: hypothetical protein WD342_03570 [Verrucomicrobiales bacterium]